MVDGLKHSRLIWNSRLGIHWLRSFRRAFQRAIRSSKGTLCPVTTRTAFKTSPASTNRLCSHGMKL